MKISILTQSSGYILTTQDPRGNWKLHFIKGQVTEWNFIPESSALIIILVTFKVCLDNCVQISILLIALEFDSELYFCPSVYDYLQCTEIKIV